MFKYLALARLALRALPLGEHCQEPGHKSLYIKLSAGDGTVVVDLIAKDWRFPHHYPATPGRMEYPKESPFVVPWIDRLLGSFRVRDGIVAPYWRR